ncbi:MAG TPA: amino acid adenylation domain-containing protein, partial [Longimicrobiaceae bacterium]|nr:amino acid adenylation domain-containing protein [Longimicrobiaceae bacterium]
PKGVQVEHRGVVALLHWLRGQVRPEERAAVLCSTSVSFDVSVAEIFDTLCGGGRLVLVENALELAGAAADGDVRLAYMVPGAAAELLRMGALPASLKTLNLAGEALPAELARALHAAGVERVANVYGPTEDTVYATCSLVEPGAERVSIGRPIANARAYVLDARLRPAPVGVAGELYLAGAGVARGYLGRPDLTAERFLPEPFGGEAGARMYRTGDRVRRLANGELEYLGRLDFQVKVRGFRIELGEIEAALLSRAGVREAAVVVREDAPGERRIVGYVVADGEPATAGLREHLLARLPGYMVPSALVVLEELPLTPSGKLDRRALPAPAGAAAEAYVAPRTPAEETLAEIWGEVLGVGRVGARDDFFALGGHSLLATRVVSRLRQAFGVDVPLRTLFEAPTVAGLAARVETLLQGGGRDDAPPIVRVARDRPLPLSFAQQRLWFLQQMEPASPAYNMPFALRLRGALEVDALERALEALVRRHESLRTVFPVVDGEPVQVVREAAPFALPVADLRPLAAGARDAEARRLAASEALRPFDLAAGPLLRASLLRLEDGEWALLFTVHHVVSDGWSRAVVVRELSELYDAIASGREPALPELPVQYGDYAAWQRAWLTGGTLERQLDFWRESLRGAPPTLELPTDHSRPPVQRHRGARASLLFARPLADAVQALSRREGTTLFMTLLAAWQLLLARQAGQEDVVVGTPVANRTRTEAEGLIGFFVNTLALRTDLSGAPAFRELLARVRESTLGAYAHQDVPFEQVLEAVRPERSLSYAPVFQVFFNLFNFEESVIRLPGLAIEPLPWGAEEQSKFDLTLYVLQGEEGIRLSMLYDADLFGAARTAEMLEQYRLLLEQAVADPEASVASYSLVTAAARERIPDPALPLAAEWAGPVTAMFAAQAARSPERLAVQDAEERWSYGELDRRSAQLAHGLLAGGVQPGEVVAVYAHRSASLVWALLGILRAGAAFVVLDPAYPALRLEGYLRAARPAGWLRIAAAGEPPAAVETAAAATARCRLVLPGLAAAASAGLLDGLPAHDPEVRVGPESLAYLAFTSGTTGAPRGIAGTHRPLSHFVRWQRDAFALEADDRFTLLSGLAHDPLLRDVLTPLSLGASVHVPDPERVGAPGWLGAWMAREAVTATHLTPAMGAVLATAADARLPRLRLAFWGGEAVSAADTARLRSLAPTVRSVVFYGATETPQAVAWHPVPEDAAPGGGALPVGRGIEGAQLLVLGRGGEQAGIGEAGEIAVRTPYLALGYLDDEAGTRERFVANPATGDPADRTYRTGDLGRYRPDGAVDFLGRADHQVKVRGFRVEPREVEAALERHASVREAVVVARGGGDAGRRLVAYVVAEGGAADAAALRLHLRETLPEYMVPAAFVALERLPLTPNGKLDRRALPAPEWTADAGAYAAPRTPVEE